MADHSASSPQHPKGAAPVIAPKKLIEVAIPLDAINKACAREKSIRHGHPSTLHLWWARRPLAAARAVLFAQLVNDPSWKYSDEELKKNQIKGAITKKRNELFQLITDLVQWENTNNEDVLERARKEIRASWKETCEANRNHPDAKTLFDPNKLPAFHDPFAGGGAIPLEAQRLGLEAHASDLNPVAVLINKAMIEVPPKFAGRAPVGPIPKSEKQTKAAAVEDWSGARGLAEDVRRYGAWMRDEAERRIGSLFPKMEITREMTKERPDLKALVGEKFTVIAWLWARTVASPSPAWSHVDVPLVANFWLSTKPDRRTWIEPVVDKKNGAYRFRICGDRHKEPEVESTVGRTGGTCLLSGSPIPFQYIRAEAKSGRLKARLMTVVLEGRGRRIYVAPTVEMEALAGAARPENPPGTSLPEKALGFRVQEYGITKHRDLFTNRQLVALTTLSDLAAEVVGRCRRDAVAAGMVDDNLALHQGGHGARAYADAIATFLAFAVDRVANYCSTICTWHSGVKYETVTSTFGRQAIPMTWDFAEGNPLSDSSGNFEGGVKWLAAVLSELPASVPGVVTQQDAGGVVADGRVISTDPPYYDNIGYADLSDFFYIWLRRSLKASYPDLFATVTTPKAEELVATPFRHGSREQAEQFFLDGMTRAMTRLALQTSRSAPITIYYAFKQSDTDSGDGTASTGWEAFLEAVLRAGLSIVGTWPMRTEYTGNLKKNVSALASSIVLVCRPRLMGAHQIARKDFLRQLERALPSALAEMTADPAASVAPVDLAQAAIGPGMAIFSKYDAVLEADGTAMTVHNALTHINKAIDAHFGEAEGDLDADTRFCIGWFQQYGFDPGPFGEADVLARAKGTAVDGVVEAGVLAETKSKVRLLKIKEYPKKWDPTTDTRVPVWEACHHMCRALGDSEQTAGALLARMAHRQEPIRQLAYQLYTICERQKRAEEARAYNELIASWPAIVAASRDVGYGEQLELIN